MVLTGAVERPPAGNGDAAYRTIARTFFNDGFRESPSSATTAGVHAYDARWTMSRPQHTAAV